MQHPSQISLHVKAGNFSSYNIDTAAYLIA